MSQIKDLNEWVGKTVAKVYFFEYHAEMFVRFEDGSYSKISAMSEDYTACLRAEPAASDLDLQMIGVLTEEEYNENP